MMAKWSDGVPTDLSVSAQAFKALCDIVIKVSGQITALFSELIAALVTTSMGDIEAEAINIPDGPKISAFTLPYFFDESDSFPRSP